MELDSRYRIIGLDLAAYESVIADKFPETFVDAKHIYSAIVSWLERLQEYTQKTDPEYAIDVNMLADSHMGMSFYLVDKSNKCKMIKRGIDLLEDILKNLDKTLKTKLFREMCLKLGHFYSEMLKLKIELYSANPTKPKKGAADKIHNLFNKAIFHQNNYISNSVRTDDLLLKLALSNCNSLCKLMDIWKPEIEFKKLRLHYIGLLLRHPFVVGNIRHGLKAEYDECELMIMLQSATL